MCGYPRFVTLNCVWMQTACIMEFNLDYILRSEKANQIVSLKHYCCGTFTCCYTVFWRCLHLSDRLPSHCNISNSNRFLSVFQLFLWSLPDTSRSRACPSNSLLGLMGKHHTTEQCIKLTTFIHVVAAFLLRIPSMSHGLHSWRADRNRWTERQMLKAVNIDQTSPK